VSKYPPSWRSPVQMGGAFIAPGIFERAGLVARDRPPHSEGSRAITTFLGGLERPEVSWRSRIDHAPRVLHVCSRSARSLSDASMRLLSQAGGHRPALHCLPAGARPNAAAAAAAAAAEGGTERQREAAAAADAAVVGALVPWLRWDQNPFWRCIPPPRARAALFHRASMQPARDPYSLGGGVCG
jgi:hypothetical protein